MVVALAAIGAYILLVGVASFIENPVGCGFDALQLNALIRVGSAILAIAAFVAVRGMSLPVPLPLAAGIGIGLLAGAGSICYFLGLTRPPVSIAVGAANGYVVVTILLGVLIGYEGLPWPKRLSIALTVAGVTLFAFSA